MGDKPPANLEELTRAISKFSAAAYELQNIHDVLTNRTQDLVSGSDAWAGAASEQFQAAWEQFGRDTLEAAATLDRTVRTLQDLARDIKSVQNSPSGKLVQAIDTGHVKVVSNMTVASPAHNVIHASEAVHAYRAVSNAYDVVASDSANGFAAAAHATTSGARLTGGVHSATVGISHAGWSTSPHVKAGDTGTNADFTQPLAHDGRQAHQTARQSDDAVPLAPGIFTGTSSGEGMPDDATGFGPRAQTSGAGDDVSASRADDETTGAPAPSKPRDDLASGGSILGRTYTRADLGGSPSDAALAAARRQDTITTPA